MNASKRTGRITQHSPKKKKKKGMKNMEDISLKGPNIGLIIDYNNPQSKQV